MENRIRRVVQEWFETEIPELRERDFIPLDLENDIIISVTGIRRSGKTYTLFEAAGKLRNKYSRYNIVYINFEDLRLLPLQAEDLIRLPDLLLEYFPVKKDEPVWFLLDEIQNVPDWDRVLRNFLDQRRAHLIITGSNSGLLPDKLANVLRGRTFTIRIYPLSFKEYLDFRDFDFLEPGDLYLSSRKPELLSHFNDYLEYGGFPKVLSLSRDQKNIYLSDLFRSIFYRDVIENYNIRNINTFEIFLKLLAETNSALFSISKISRFLKNSLGIGVSKNTLQDYLFYSKSAFLLYDVEIFSYKLKNRLQYPRKLYFADPGIVNSLIFKHNIQPGRLLEQLVFLELKRRNADIFYWKDQTHSEVDFVVVHGSSVNQLIQACYEVNKLSRKREEKAILKAMYEFNLKEGLIITKDHEEKVQKNSKTITYIPFYKWIL